MSFADYIADTLTSAIAEAPDCADFILRPEDNGEIVYVDVEEGAFFLITVRAAEAVAKEELA